jgi:hypothetical protein
MRRLILIWVCCLTSAGCAVNQVRRDHDQIRCALLDLYTNQLMDNLIRVRNGLPIVEIDYTNATATVTVHENGAAADSPLATTHSDALTLAKASSLMATRTVLNTVSGTFSADRSNQVQVTANPVSTSPEAYEAYRQFLAIPGGLEVSTCPPPEGAAHLCKRCGKQYYWVPAAFKKQFLALALAAVTDRTAALPPPDPFYSVTLLSPVSQTSEGKGIYRIIIRMDKPIPNDVGLVEVGTGGSAVRFRIAEYLPPGPQRLSQTDQLVVYYDENKAPAGLKPVSTFVASLPMAAKVYLANHRPAPAAVSPDLRFIEFELQQIQLNQIRTGL